MKPCKKYKPLHRWGGKEISLTAGEKEWASWAIDAMTAMPDDEREEMWGKIIPDEQLPKVVGGKLVMPVSLDPEVLDDMMYRIEEQAPEMLSSARTDQEASGAMRVLERLADKLRLAATGRR